METPQTRGERLLEAVVAVERLGACVTGLSMTRAQLVQYWDGVRAFPDGVGRYLVLGIPVELVDAPHPPDYYTDNPPR